MRPSSYCSFFEHQVAHQLSRVSVFGHLEQGFAVVCLNLKGFFFFFCSSKYFFKELNLESCELSIYSAEELHAEISLSF